MTSSSLARRYLVISIVMVAALVEPDARGRVANARVAVGACSPAARRLASLEAKLAGADLSEPLESLVEPSDLEVLGPIDDVRGSAAYRSEAALVLTRRALWELRSESA